MANHKACTKCGEDKPLSEYYSNKPAHDGLRPNCKSCHKLIQAAYRATHREEQRARNKAWWAATDRGQAKIALKKWQAAHPEKCAAHRRRYKRTPLGKAAVARSDTKRRMRKLNTSATVALTAEERQARITEYGSHCCWCGKELAENEVVMDHIIALASGGAHVASNVAPSCQPCNSRKAALDWGYPYPGVPREDAQPEMGSEWL